MSKNNHWSTDNIPDLTGRTAVVTGANSGLGLETSRVLVGKGAEVILACRNLEKGATAVAQIKAQHAQAQIALLQLDLADLASVRGFAETFTAQYDQLHLLINNAGVMAPSKRYVTADGFEMQFGTNHLGHFALTGPLLPTLMQTPNARIVSLSSVAHRLGKMNFDDLNAEKSYNKWSAYGQSKLANLLFTYELQRHLQQANADVIAVAAHPGYTATNLQKTSRTFSWLNPIVAQDISIGVLPPLYAATVPDIQGGDFIGPDGFQEMRGYPHKTRSSDRSYNQADAAKLWQVSEQLTGINYPV